MTRQEAARVLAVIQSRYPQANFGRPETAAEAWAMTLDDVPYGSVMTALGSWFKANRWPPDPSELRGLVLAEANAVPDAADAWEMVLRHMRENGRIGGFPFAGPEPVRQAVEAIGGWHVLRMSEFPGKDRESFERVYPTYAKRAMAGVNVGELLRERVAALEAGE
jgi:hypothetical protein